MRTDVRLRYCFLRDAGASDSVGVAGGPRHGIRTLLLGGGLQIGVLLLTFQLEKTWRVVEKTCVDGYYGMILCRVTSAWLSSVSRLEGSYTLNGSQTGR